MSLMFANNIMVILSIMVEMLSSCKLLSCQYWQRCCLIIMSEMVEMILFANKIYRVFEWKKFRNIWMETFIVFHKSKFKEQAENGLQSRSGWHELSWMTFMDDWTLLFISYFYILMTDRQTYIGTWYLLSCYQDWKHTFSCHCILKVCFSHLQFYIKGNW